MDDRDWIATAAFAGMLSGLMSRGIEFQYDEIAGDAYDAADWMLKERERRLRELDMREVDQGVKLPAPGEP